MKINEIINSGSSFSYEELLMIKGGDTVPKDNTNTAWACSCSGGDGNNKNDAFCCSCE